MLLYEQVRTLLRSIPRSFTTILTCLSATGIYRHQPLLSHRRASRLFHPQDRCFIGVDQFWSPRPESNTHATNCRSRRTDPILYIIRAVRYDLFNFYTSGGIVPISTPTHLQSRVSALMLRYLTGGISPISTPQAGSLRPQHLPDPKPTEV